MKSTTRNYNNKGHRAAFILTIIAFLIAIVTLGHDICDTYLNLNTASDISLNEALIKVDLIIMSLHFISLSMVIGLFISACMNKDMFYDFKTLGLLVGYLFMYPGLKFFASLYHGIYLTGYEFPWLDGGFAIGFLVIGLALIIATFCLNEKNAHSLHAAVEVVHIMHIVFCILNIADCVLPMVRYEFSVPLLLEAIVHIMLVVVSIAMIFNLNSFKAALHPHKSAKELKKEAEAKQ